MSETSKRIVIVGAGAMGVATGYHLSLAGAEITYLVRPASLSKLPSTLTLYSYDDGENHRFGGYQVISDAAKMADINPDFVLLTLDGASLSNDEGKALLAQIGAAIHNTDATLIMGAVGIGLRELTVEATGLPDDRVISGMIALVAYKTAGVDLPVHEPTDPAKLKAADFAFRHLNEGGFLLESRNEKAAARFAEVFDKSGIGKCFVVPSDEFGVQTRGIMPIFITSQILGWPTPDALYADALWPITVEAVRAIQGLPEHGEAGKAAAGGTNAEGLAGIWGYLSSAALPLDWQAFNAYHHGEKVNSADVQLLKACIERGKAGGHDMSAVQEIVVKWEARHG